ncbi:hypothetical protein ACOMHN_014628 [Nucella lapillus]
MDRRDNNEGSTSGQSARGGTVDNVQSDAHVVTEKDKRTSEMTTQYPIGSGQFADHGVTEKDKGASEMTTQYPIDCGQLDDHGVTEKDKGASKMTTHLPLDTGQHDNQGDSEQDNWTAEMTTQYPIGSGQLDDHGVTEKDKGASKMTTHLPLDTGQHDNQGDSEQDNWTAEMTTQYPIGSGQLDDHGVTEKDKGASKMTTHLPLDTGQRANQGDSEQDNWTAEMTTQYPIGSGQFDDHGVTEKDKGASKMTTHLPLGIGQLGNQGDSKQVKGKSEMTTHYSMEKSQCGDSGVSEKDKGTSKMTTHNPVDRDQFDDQCDSKQDTGTSEMTTHNPVDRGQFDDQCDSEQDTGTSEMTTHNPVDRGQFDDQCDSEQDTGTSKMTTHNPVDRGWAWIIVLSVFGIQFVCCGLLRSFGVIFVAIQLSFQSSASMVALLGGVESAFFSIADEPFWQGRYWLWRAEKGVRQMNHIGRVVIGCGRLRKVSVRRTILAGSLLAVAGFVGCFLSSQIVHLIFCFSVCLGVSMGLLIGPGFVLLNAYFKHKLPFATAMANTGGSIGSIVMPIATRMLLDYYFLSGAFLLLGAIFAQILVFGALLTPTEDYKPAQVSHPAYIPALAQEKGLTTTQGALLLTISGGLDILSRLVPGILAQYNLVMPKTSVVVSLLVLGVLFQFTALAEDMVALTALSVVYGLFSGVFFSMLPLIILDFNTTHFRQVFGFTQLALGIGGFSGFSIVGYLKDTSGSYVTSFYFMGICGLLASLLLVLMSVLQRREAGTQGSIPDPERPSKGRG